MSIIIGNYFLFQVPKDSFLRSGNFYSKELFLFTTIYGQYPMTGYLFDILLKVIIHFIYRLSILILCYRYKLSFLRGGFTDVASKLRFVRHLLCKDIHGSGDGCLYGSHFLLLGKIIFRMLAYRFVGFLSLYNFSQSVKPLFFGNRGSGSSLWPIRTI